MPKFVIEALITLALSCYQNRKIKTDITLMKMNPKIKKTNTGKDKTLHKK